MRHFLSVAEATPHDLCRMFDLVRMRSVLRGVELGTIVRLSTLEQPCTGVRGGDRVGVDPSPRRLVMRLAVLSGIHGNVRVLDAVPADID